MRVKGFLLSEVCQVIHEGIEAAICIGTNERVYRYKTLFSRSKIWRDQARALKSEQRKDKDAVL